jgi:hypothetical protein
VYESVRKRGRARGGDGEEEGEEEEREMNDYILTIWLSCTH